MKFLLTAFSLLLLGLSHAAAAQIWQLDASTQARGVAEGAVFRADDAALRAALAAAGYDGSPGPRQRIDLPMPDGGLKTFDLIEASIMAPGLAAKYPEIKSYKVFGVDGEAGYGRLSISPLGFHGMVDTAAGTVMIDPRLAGAPDQLYLARFKRDVGGPGFRCGVHGSHSDLKTWLAPQFRSANRIEGSLLQYRIAVAATFEYFSQFGSTGATLAAIGLTLTRVNMIYERDLGITLQLIGDNDLILETTDTGQLDNEDEFVLLGQVDDWIDARLPGGDLDYDVGHVFSKPASLFGAGVARIGAACDDTVKASGVSGSPTPSGDAFDIDLVAHEIGHQFAAEHTFNGTTSSCLGNRASATAFEPGSGSTIMAYAGICGAENLQANSDDTFHAGSIAQIDAFTAAGGNCYNPIANGNTDPSIAAINDTAIPADTPFILSGTATDPDAGTTLSYQWDQMDAGCPTDAATFGTDNGSNALFRSYRPVDNESQRNFPALGTQLGGQYDKAEVLACHSRALDFRLTVRDDASGQDTEDVRVTVDDSAGPFVVTAPNTPGTTITDGGPVTVTWDSAGTEAGTINCANVDIDLLTFAPGYATYSIHPLTTVANTAETASVTIVPATSENSQARIRVKCSSSIFYDISDADLIVDSTDPGATPFDVDDFQTRFNLSGTVSGVAPVCGPIVDCSPPPVIDPNAGRNDATAFDWRLLALLFALFGLRARR